MDTFFIGHFLRNPRNVGALVPLSHFAAESMTAFLQQHPKRSLRILEAGAGTGSVTQSIVRHLGPDDFLDVIEIDSACCEHLEKLFAGDSRVSIHCQSILDWTSDKKYDLVYSTLPMNSFSPELVKKVFSHYKQLLLPGGIVSYVEYIGLASLGLLFSCGELKEERKKRLKVLKELQNDYLTDEVNVYLNFLPLKIYRLRFT
jgi:phosphatidylethanolamine/phosphatidyl-N-methylethanolamine N-methyltransferase